MAQRVTVYEDAASVTVADAADFPLGEFTPLCDLPVEIQPVVCPDRSFDCTEAIIAVVPEGWWRGEPVTEFTESSDYGFHLEDNPSCDLSRGFYLMIPDWSA